MSAADRANVEDEAREKGVDPLEIVRRSLDILIQEIGQTRGAA
ncbi:MULTISPECIES: hypothetical protein [Methylobacterium]|nr:MULTISPECIES: hypothetical protein [Methylobacterium]